MLEAICSINKIQNGRIILGCDGRGALEKIQHRTSTLSAKHFDYITSIKSILSSLPIKVTFVHVTGHADKKIPLHQLSPLERMNVQVDTLAKEHNERLRQDDELEALDLNREAGPVRISCGQQLTKIKSKFRNKLYETITAIPTETYWLEKLKIDSNQRKNIEWTQMGLAFEEIPIERQKELVKWNSDFCGTSKNLKRWKEQSHQRCPVCGHDGEDTHHILTCPHPDPKQAWNKTITSIKNWLLQQPTDQDLIDAIINHLQAWRNNQPPGNYKGQKRELLEAIDQQNQIRQKICKDYSRENRIEDG